MSMGSCTRLRGLTGRTVGVRKKTRSEGVTEHVLHQSCPERSRVKEESLKIGSIRYHEVDSPDTTETIAKYEYQLSVSDWNMSSSLVPEKVIKRLGKIQQNSMFFKKRSGKSKEPCN